MELYAMHFEGNVGNGLPVFYVSNDCVAALHRAIDEGQLGDVRIASVEHIQVSGPAGDLHSQEPQLSA